MKKWFKKGINKITKSLGFRILKNASYERLIWDSRNIPSNTEKNNLLDHFFNILKNQGFYPETVYDVGANKGTWSLECMRFFPEANFYLFEPQENLSKEIKDTLKDYNNYTVFPFGLGNINGELNFTFHERDDSSSFSYTRLEAEDRGFQQIKVPVFCLNDIVEEKKLRKPSILKIDAEGFDLKVLEGAENLLDEVEIILIEVGIMNKRIPNSALKILNIMDGYGFRLFDITDLNRPFLNEVLWLCEFVFIKKHGLLDNNYSRD